MNNSQFNSYYKTSKHHAIKANEFTGIEPLVDIPLIRLDRYDQQIPVKGMCTGIHWQES